MKLETEEEREAYREEHSEIEEVMKYKIERQLKRIEEQQCINSNQD